MDINLLEKAFEAGRNNGYHGKDNIELCIKFNGYFSFEEWMLFEKLDTSDSVLPIPCVIKSVCGVSIIGDWCISCEYKGECELYKDSKQDVL